MPVSETPSTAPTHLEAEARMVVRALRSYGPLPERTLRLLVGGEHWRDGDVRLALAVAVERGLARRLGAGFYAPAERGRRASLGAAPGSS